MLSKDVEKVSLAYHSQLSENDFITLLTNNTAKDRANHYTNFGVHKDDLTFKIDEFPLKKFGSQGQQKTYLLALKLAQASLIQEITNKKVIFLLDDIFDKLDEQRVKQIITLVDDENFGQLFITDTHPERTEQIIKSAHQTYQMFNLGESIMIKN